MVSRRILGRVGAVGILVGLIALAGTTAASWVDDYADGKREIADMREQLQGLRELAEARASFDRLVPKSGKPNLIVPADTDAQAVLATALAHAAEGQQVILDSVEPAPPSDPVLATTAVHLRGTQAGLYAVLRAIEQQTPYLTVSRLDLTVSRAADPEHAKPLVLAADMRVAALQAPSPPPKLAPSLTPASQTP